MTIQQDTRDAYARYRKTHPYTPATVALAVARRENSVPAWADALKGTTLYGYGTVDAWTGHVDGFGVTVTAEPDDVDDMSWLGTWTDDDGPDTVPNPDGGEPASYKYFRVENVQDWRDYWRQGMSRADARAAVRAAMEEDAREALKAQLFITVTVERDGTEVGTDTLGGCQGYESALWAVDDNGMLGNAMSEAKAAVAREVAADDVRKGRAAAIRELAATIAAYRDTPAVPQADRLADAVEVFLSFPPADAS
jgi:hypothetical protein